MSRPFIVLGDKTDHGGVVIEASPTSDAAGKGLARVGDKVSCPQRGHGGTTVIVSGDPTMIIDGRAVARHGDKTACGATLIAGQAVAYIDANSDLGSVSPGLVAGPTATVKAKEQQADAVLAQKYDLHFLVQDDKTGQPVSGAPYQIALASGKMISGKTNAQGLTELIAADTPEIAKLVVPFYESAQADTKMSHAPDCCSA